MVALKITHNSKHKEHKLSPLNIYRGENTQDL